MRYAHTKDVSPLVFSSHLWSQPKLPHLVLDRDRLYQHMVVHHLLAYRVSMLATIIQLGDPRVGKSRLYP